MKKPITLSTFQRRVLRDFWQRFMCDGPLTMVGAKAAAKAAAKWALMPSGGTVVKLPKRMGR